MRESILQIEGMTCHSCERRIEMGLRKLPGVESATASQAGGRAIVRHQEEVEFPELKAAVERAGYVVREKKGKSTPIALGIGLALAALYLVGDSMGAFNNFPMADRSIGYGMLIIIGLLTSVHCVAMCGGIAISQSVGKVGAMPLEGGREDRRSTLRDLVPGLLYNGGRIISYTIVGAIVGGLGSVFSFSESMKGAITALAGFFMLWLGLKMMGLIPALPQSPGFIPAPIRRIIGGVAAKLPKRSGSRGPLVVGLLGGLMPCGPLQTMQLYALGTGSIGAGALSMFLFSAGTVPLMLIFSAAAAVLPRKFVPAMVKASSVLVLLLGTLTLGRAAALAGITIPNPFAQGGLQGLEASLGSAPLVQPVLYAKGAAPGQSSANAAGTGGGPSDQGGTTATPAAGPGDGIPRATISGGVQTVVTVFGSNNYMPFYAQAGIPLRWIIKIRKEDINGCNRTVIVPAYKIRKDLQPGDNIIEFTPTKAGVVPYSCWMGMIRSAFGVVEDLGKAGSGASSSGSNAAAAQAATAAAGLGGEANANPAGPQASLASALAIPEDGSGYSGGGCCGGGTDAGLDLDHIGIAKLQGGVQEITVRVDGNGYSPSAIVMQKGVKAVIHFEAAELDGCNDIVYFPDYNGSLDLSQGQLSTPAIPVSGDFTFQCSMNMLHGYVKVVDDLARVKLSEVKKELASWTPPAGGGCCGN